MIKFSGTKVIAIQLHKYSKKLRLFNKALYFELMYLILNLDNIILDWLDNKNKIDKKIN